MKCNQPRPGFELASISKDDNHYTTCTSIILYVWWDHRDIIHFVFLNHSKTLDADFCSQQLQRMHEKLFRKRPVLVTKKICFSMITQSHIQQESRRKNIGFRLFCFTSTTILTRPCTQWFPSFLFSLKYFEWQKNFFKKSSKNFSGKPLSLETSWILREGNQKTTW